MMRSCMRQGGGLTAWIGDWYDAFLSHSLPRDEIAMPKWTNTNDLYVLKSRNSS